jgi:hypothetical protein
MIPLRLVIDTNILVSAAPGFFARQPRARMTEQEIEQDRNCHYDLPSSIGELASRAKESATQPSEARQSKVKHLARVSARLIPLEKKEIGILREARGQ